MKVGTVVGVHAAALCAFALTQGCVTSESQGSGRGAGAHHRGIVTHQYKGRVASSSSSSSVAVEPQNAFDPIGDSMDSIYDPIVVETSDTVVEPYIAPVASSGSYVVQKGDVLSKIASKFGTSSATLVQMNNLSNPDVLYVGQELRVPNGGGSNYVAPKLSFSSVKKGGTYTIQKGDTLSGIAVAAGVSLNDLRSLNNIQNDRIMAGETLDIPVGGKVPTKTQKSKPKKKKAAPEPMIEAPVMAPLAPAAPVDAVSVSVDMIEEKMLYPGETLDDVARQYGVSKAEIMRLNNISDETAVRTGMTLRIPIAE